MKIGSKDQIFLRPNDVHKSLEYFPSAGVLPNRRHQIVATTVSTGMPCHKLSYGDFPSDTEFELSCSYWSRSIIRLRTCRCPTCRCRVREYTLVPIWDIVLTTITANCYSRCKLRSEYNDSLYNFWYNTEHFTYQNSIILEDTCLEQHVYAVRRL